MVVVVVGGGVEDAVDRLGCLTLTLNKENLEFVVVVAVAVVAFEFWSFDRGGYLDQKFDCCCWKTGFVLMDLDTS